MNIYIYEKKRFGYSPVKRIPRLAGMILLFFYIRLLVPVFRDMQLGIVLSLLQFDFSYSSTIITLNSAFIHGLSALNSNPLKDICDL